MNITLSSSPVAGTIRIPSSKSQTIRALLLATFAKGPSTLFSALDSVDTRTCIALCQSLGAKIIEHSEIEGGLTLFVTPGPSFPSSVFLECGNSGTTMYLALGLVASLGIEATFSGDEQLNSRPVAPLLTAYEQLGAKVRYLENEGYPPFMITGPLHGGDISIACPTSQYLSSLLLGTFKALAKTSITVPLLHERPYVEMTLQWLKELSIACQYDKQLSYFEVGPKQTYKGFEATIAGDYSSASFFFCAAAIASGPVTIKGLNKDDVQGDKDVLDVLTQMGCQISWQDNQVTVSNPSGVLNGGTFDLNAIPDALPILAVTACYANGTTSLINVPQARIKETDRIAVMAKNLRACQADVKEVKDGLIINGKGGLQGGTVSGYDDHRIIMAMAIGALASATPITINGIEAANITFPTFFTLLDTIRRDYEHL